MKKLFYILAGLLLTMALSGCVKDEIYTDNTPDPEDSPLKGKLVLNEINGQGADADKYIELYNNSAEDISLAGIAIYYNNMGSDPKATWTGSTQTIQAGKYLVLQGTKGTGDMTTGLSGTQGITVQILDAAGLRVDILQVGQDLTRTTEYARIPDGSGAWYFAPLPGTKGITNGTNSGGLEPITRPDTPEITGISKTPGLPGSAESVTVAAVVTTPEQTDLTSVVLKWNLNATAQSDITMTLNSGSYTAVIAPQANGSTVTFTVRATNSAGKSAEKSDSYVVTDAPMPTTGQVYINECDPANKKWELFNAETYTINIGGWSMTKDNDAAAPFIFADGTTIAAGQYLVLTQNETNSPTFGMSQTKGFKYDLFNAASVTVSTLDNFGNNILNDNMGANTIGRITDGSNLLATFSTGSIGANNNTGVALTSPVVAKVGKTPGAPTSSESVTVTANISYKEAITGVNLLYSFDGSSFTAVAMTAGANNITYSGAIPAKGSAGTVTYKFSTTPGGESGTYSYTATAVVIDYSQLALNEVDGNSKGVELYNNGSTAIPLSGVSLTKDNTDTWWTGSGASGSIAPGAYVVIYQTGFNPGGSDVDGFIGASGISMKKALKFELKDPGANSLGILDRTGTTDYTGQSFQRCPNATGDWKVAAPTNGAKNPDSGTAF